ncbi:hypothetical protein MHOL44478_23480 [Mycobacterium holsaticum DSM 44478]|nr:hypothetical protein [Mycolicibacterium holsaticum DSM 44478 = JCM 12374]
MDPTLSPALISALVVPMAIMMTVAYVVERRQRRRDRADGVLLSFDDLRLTRTHLLVGSGVDARRIPLDGLSATATTTVTEGQDADEVHVIIENAGDEIHRRLPYSYGSSGDAQMFAIKFNLLAGRSGLPAQQPRAAAPHFDRRAAA